MRTIYVNGKFLTQKITGVQRYAIEICTALIQQNRNLIILIPPKTEVENDLLEPYCKVIGFNSGVLWEQIDLARYVNKKKSTLVNLCNAAPILSRKNIVTIHDLGVYESGKWFNLFFVRWYKYMLPRIIRKSQFVITVSETVKREIQQRFDLKQKKILVAYNGVGANFQQVSNKEKEPLKISLVGLTASPPEIHFKPSLTFLGLLGPFQTSKASFNSGIQ